MKGALKIIAFILLSCIMAMGVSATTTFVTPGASASISGSSYVVNVTSNLAAFQNCSITASSVLTGDSLAATWLYNSTTTNANATIDTTALEDANDWIFAGTCYNSTGTSEAITSRTGITVDNTVPTTPTSLTPTTSTDKSSISISSTVTGSRTTSCTVTLSSTYHTETNTMTHSGNTCSATVDLPGSGDYSYTVTASDETNTSTSAAQSLKVEETGGNAAVLFADQNKTSSKSGASTIVILAILVFVGYQAGWFGKKK